MMHSIYNWFDNILFGALRARIAQLESEKFDLQHELFQSQQFESIAAGKVKEWVEKHDALLIRFKELDKQTK